MGQRDQHQYREQHRAAGRYAGATGSPQTGKHRIHSIRGFSPGKLPDADMFWMCKSKRGLDQACPMMKTSGGLGVSEDVTVGAFVASAHVAERSYAEVVDHPFQVAIVPDFIGSLVFDIYFDHQA